MKPLPHILLLLLLAGSVRAQSPGTQLDAAFERQQSAIEALQKQLADLRAQRPPLTWDDLGAKPNDPTFDNAPVLSQMLADMQTGKLRTVPVGTMADYYIKTTIKWPAWFGGDLQGSGGYNYYLRETNVGGTRIIWAGDKGGVMLEYRGSGGHIGQITLQGGIGFNFPVVAGCGILVPAIESPPSGNLVTNQLAIDGCDVGLHCLATPDYNHADTQKHHDLFMHKVRIAYWVEGDQSVCHWLDNFVLGEGWETAFKFDRGGALYCAPCNVMSDTSERLQTLLYCGRQNDDNGSFDIHGLQVDGSVKNLRFVDHGKYVFRVRITGNVGKESQVAEPMVVAHEPLSFDQKTGKPLWVDVRVDCKCAQWPIVKGTK